MAASGMPKASSSSGPVPPLSKTPSRAQSLQRTPSRRVYFSDDPPPPKNQDTQKQHWEEEESDEDQKERRGCGLCCAWSSLIAGCIILFLLLSGALFLFFLQAALPEFRVKRLNIAKVELVSSKGKSTLLSTNVQLLINATNKNDKYNLSYGPLKVHVSLEQLDLGKTEVSPFKQKPLQVSELKVQTGTKKSEVNEDDAKALKENYKSRQVVINVVFKGSISMNLGGQEFKGLPLTVLCNNIAQSDIDNGLQPPCRVKMFSFV